MRNKILSLILTLCMLLSLFPFAVGTSALAADESGTVHLTSAEDVLALMTDSTLWDKTVVLDGDVDLAGVDGQAPIGNAATVFSGTFDGQNHTISGVKLSGDTAVGFFGKTTGATIRNLTLEGTVTATGNASGGFVGWGIVPLTIENCTNRIDVTGVNRAAGFVGSMDMNSTANLTVTGCKNYGTIEGTGSEGHVGGLFGRLYKTTANQTTVITDCENYGNVTATKQMAGGLVGRYEASSAVKAGDTVITRFANYGTVSTPSYAGGAFGIFTSSAASASAVSEIYNAGDINATTGKYVGGIAGYFRSYTDDTVHLSDCMNIGKIHSGTTVAGGIIGTGNGSNHKIVYTRLYNAGSVTAGTQGWVGAVVGAVSPTSTMTDCFYSSTDTYTAETGKYENATQIAVASTVEENKALLAAFDASELWTITKTGPELSAYHTHTDEDADGICDSCELPTSCAHANTRTETTPATCVSTGITKVICEDCGKVVSETTLAIDPANHTGAPALSLADGKMVYTCGCGQTYAETTEPLTEIKVGEGGVATLPSASVDTFADFETAMQYAALVSTAAQGVTVRLLDETAESRENYKTPAYEGTITVTGGKLTIAGTKWRRFVLNGDLTFENIKLASTLDGLIVAQNHALTMGEGVDTGATVAENKLYIIGAFQDGGSFDSNVTIRSGRWHVVAGANRQDASRPYSGTARLTVGKTNAADTLEISQMIPFSTNGGTLSETSKAIVRIDGEAVIDKFYTNIYPQSTVYTDGVEYIVDVILTGDIQNTDPSVSGGVNLVYEATAGTNKAIGVLNVYNIDVPGASDASAEDLGEFLGYANDNITVNLKTGAEYCVDYNGGHEDADGDGECDKCHAPMACEHINFHDGAVVPSTCGTKGSVEHICDDCGVFFETAELPLDPENHVGTDYVWYQNNEGVFYYACTGCGAVMGTQTDLPTVYLDGVGGDDANDGLTADTEVKTLEEAVKRLAVTGGQVMFTARLNVTGDITLPAYARPITLSGVTDASGNATGGFVIQTANALLTLGGETVFDTIVFKGEGAAHMNIEADWNDVSFGYVRIHKNATIGLYAGHYLSAADDTEAKTATINLKGAVIASDNASDHVFYKTVVLGSWFGADGQTVSNKTVTLNADNGALPNGTAVAAKIGTLYTMSSTGDTARRHTNTPNCAATVNLNGETTVTTLRSGDKNVNGSATVTDATGYLDSLTVNFNDNSTLGATAMFRNVKSGTVKVSNESEGRTEAITNQIQFQRFGVFATDGTVGQIRAIYGEHSFAPSLTGTIFVLAGHEGSYQFTADITPEHLWDGGVITTPATPEADGVRTYTCTVCGATETESVPFACVYHQWIPTENGAYVCAVCGSETETLSAPAALRIESVTVENGTAKIVLSFESSVPFTAFEFRVKVPAEFTYSTVETALDTAPEDVDVSTLTDLTFVCGTDAMSVIHIKGENVPSYAKANILTLVYNVADTFAAESTDVVLEVVEALNAELDLIDVDSVGYVLKTSPHTHAYVAEVTKAATCGEDGVMTYTSACGDSYTEVIPATGEHSFGEWIVTKPAEVGEAGEETRTCTVCGAVETRATEPLPANYAAYIGETGYRTVQAAMDAAEALATITVKEGTTETVTPKTTVYLAGDYSGITVSGDYTLDVPGRYVRSGNAIVEDTMIKYTPAAVKAIVRPTAVTEIQKQKTSTTLSLESSVQVVFATRTAFADGYADYYAVLELLGADGTTVDSENADSVATKVVITDKTISATDSGRYAYVFDGTPAKCMNNTVRYTCYGIKADGSVESFVMDYSIRSYLQAQLNSSDAALRGLVISIANYGAAAQNYFGYNTEELVNSILAEEDREDVIADFSDITLEAVLAPEDDLPQSEAWIRGVAVSLELLDKVNIQVGVRTTGVAADHSSVTAVYSLTDTVTGEVQTYTVPFEDWAYNASEGRYYISMNQIPAKNLRQTVTLDIYKDYGKDTQASVYTYKNVQFNGAEYYCARQTGSSASDTLKVLCYSLVRYADAAKVYFAK